jgi:hypothetical protein
VFVSNIKVPCYWLRLARKNNVEMDLPSIALFTGKGQRRKRYAGGICRTPLIKESPADIPVLLYLLPGVGKMRREL